MSNTENITISINRQILAELEENIDHRKNDSHSLIFDRLLQEFNRMYAILERHNLIDELHPEWRHESERFFDYDSQYLSKLSEKKE